MPTDIRIDLQVEGMTARGHRHLFTTRAAGSWDEVDKVASALCAVYQKPVVALMTTYEVIQNPDTEEPLCIIREKGRFLGRFVPYGFAPRGTIFIDETVYDCVD